MILFLSQLLNRYSPPFLPPPSFSYVTLPSGPPVLGGMPVPPRKKKAALLSLGLLGQREQAAAASAVISSSNSGPSQEASSSSEVEPFLLPSGLHGCAAWMRQLYVVPEHLHFPHGPV